MMALWSLKAVAFASSVQVTDMTERGKKHFRPERDFQVYAVVSALTIGISMLVNHLHAKRKRRNQEINLPGRQAGSWLARSSKDRWWTRTGIDLIAFGSIAFYCWVTNFGELIELVKYRDAFHHWDHYLMGPALQFRHGKSLGTEAFAQYGVGWPMLVTALSGRHALDYGMVLKLAAAAQFLYFLGLYFFLRAWLRSCTWALAGTWLAFWAHVFLGGGIDLLIFPSSSILRYFFDIACFAALLGHARSGRLLFAGLAGAAAGLAVVFGTDTGIYLTAATSCYAAACVYMRPSRRLIGSIAGGVFAWLAVTLLGLGIASRGSFTSSTYWLGWSESLWVYGAGLGSLPIRDLGRSPFALATLALVLFVYLFVVCRMMTRLARRTETFEGILRGAISTYGMGTFILFISRSAFQNLFHPIVPCCVLLTVEAYRYTRLWGRRAPAVSKYAGAVAIFGALGLLLAAQRGLPRPGLMDEALRRSVLSQTMPRLEDRERWLQLTPRIKQWQAEGKQIAILGSQDTGCLIEADVTPYWRYSPLGEQMVFWKQVNNLKQGLRNAPPDVAVIPGPGNGEALYRDVVEALRSELMGDFRLGETTGGLEIYYRK
jgi:hypothetical protein